MGVASGCGCKEVYRYPHTTYPFFFAAASLLFVNKKNVFRSCSSIFVIKFYVLNNFFHAV